MLGIDCFYDGGLSLTGAICLAAEQDRILLTQKPVAETKRVKVFRIRDQDPTAQLIQIASSFSIDKCIKLFSRCLECNTQLERYSYDDNDRHTRIMPARPDIPASVIKRQLPLFQCPGCAKVYWHGSHVERMIERLKNAGFQVTHRINENH